MPVVLGAITTWVVAKIKEVRLKVQSDELAYAMSVIRQLVLAAEQNGLTGALKNVGQEKKAYVIAMAEKALTDKGIYLDLDVLDALIEAAVLDAINRAKLELQQ